MSFIPHFRRTRIQEYLLRIAHVQCFEDFVPVPVNSYVLAGNSQIVVHGFETVRVHAVKPNEDKLHILKLQNVVCIPAFHTNLVSFRRARKAGILWDTERDILYEWTNLPRQWMYGIGVSATPTRKP